MTKKMMMMTQWSMRLLAAGLTLLVLAWPSGGAAQELDGNGGRKEAGGTPLPRSVSAVTTPDAAIRLDGHLDEAAWRNATPATDFVQQTPDEGEPATQPTEVRILLDGESLYVGARMLDDAPDGIVARLGRRDEAVYSDWFFVYLDSYHDRRSAFAFGVNAAGVERDVRLSDDTRRDPSWDAVWEAAVSVDANGWTAEMRIPLSQLRFNTGDEGAERRWGANFARTLARRNETSFWSPVPQDANGFVSHFGELAGVDRLEPPGRLELTPYSVARVTRAPGDPDDPFYDETDPFASLGGDLRVGLGPGLTLSATLNPDFGQVEADPAFINLSAFEVFQQERRPFFVEGQEIFRPVYSPGPPVFYSRRIGRRPQGGLPSEAEWSDAPEATTILGAAKVSGKTQDGWSVGLLDAVTAEESAPWEDAAGNRGSAVVEPRTNYAVARVARELNGGNTTLGVLATSTHRSVDGTALDDLHDQAYVAGVDGFHRFGDYEVLFNLTGSHVRGSEDAIARTQRSSARYFQRSDAEHLDFDPRRTSLSGARGGVQLRKSRGSWRFLGNVLASSPGFETNDLGFGQSTDRVFGYANLEYHDFTPGTLFRRWNLGVAQGRGMTFGGERETQFVEAMGGYQLLSYWAGGFWMQRHLGGGLSTTALRGGPALRRPGFTAGGFWINSDRRKPVTGNLFTYWNVEDETDGYSTNVNLSLSLQASDRLELSLGPSVLRNLNPWQYLTTRIVDDGPLYLVARADQTTVSLSTRLSYTFTPDLTLQLWARPFLARVRYSEPREVADPRAESFEARFRSYGDRELTVARNEDGGRVFRVDRDRDGAAELVLPTPDFNSASLQVNAVVRWEWRPGSTLFAVWSHDRSAFDRAPGAPGPDLGTLRDAPGRNVLLLKASYWLGG